MEQLTHNELKTMTDIKKQIIQAISNSERSHFWHIESQTLISFSDADEAADEYNDQIEAAPEDYLQVIADSNMSEQTLAEQFILENLESGASSLNEKTAEEIFAILPNLATAWAAYREQFYGNLADKWLTENGLVG